MDQRAGKTYRLTRRKDIEQLFAAGRSARDALLTIVAMPNDRRHSRCAVGVSRRHGGAVQRNRVKRLCREAFRLSRHQVPPGWDYMIMPRVCPHLKLPAIRSSLVALAQRVTSGGQGKDGGR